MRGKPEMPGMDASVHQLLGSLVTGLENIKADIHDMKDDMRRSEAKSDVSRATVHKRMDEIVDSVAKVKTDLGEAKKDIVDMKPVTEDVRRWKLMGLGALGVVGIGGTALGVTIAGAFQHVVAFFKG